MAYIDTYRKRMTKSKSSVGEYRLNKAKDTTNINFSLASGYNLATIIPPGESTEIPADVVVKSTTSELRKRLMFRPDVIVATGSYVTCNGRTYVVREVDYDQVAPAGDAYFCNQKLNFKGSDVTLPCYSNSTTYGSKGILDQTNFYELDSKTKIFIPRNKLTETLKIGQRIMFSNRYVYKITEMDDMVFPGMFIMVAARDELLPMDDLENNLAYNESHTEQEVGTMKTSITYDIAGENSIKVNTENIYVLSPRRSDITWEVDCPDVVSVLAMENGEATIVGKSINWACVSVRDSSGRVISKKDILVHG